MNSERNPHPDGGLKVRRMDLTTLRDLSSRCFVLGIILVLRLVLCLGLASLLVMFVWLLSLLRKFVKVNILTCVSVESMRHRASTRLACLVSLAI